MEALEKGFLDIIPITSNFDLDFQFRQNRSYRLTNPVKKKLGKVSKVIIEKINKN